VYKEKAGQIGLLILFGLLSGAALQLSLLVASNLTYTPNLIITRVFESAIGMMVVLLILRKLVRLVVFRLPFSLVVKQHYDRYSDYTFFVFTVFLLGVFGLVVTKYLIARVFLGWFCIQVLLLTFLAEADVLDKTPKTLKWVTVLFIISGFSALIYQVVWQRILFTAFGVNIESITLIVSIFMFGLGIGSISGFIFLKINEYGASTYK